MGRLTVRNFENEACCTHGGCNVYEDCYECPGFQDILAKLAHYEDLEEAGRLVVIPNNITGEQLCKVVNACPSILGLKTHCGSYSCEVCWEAALKGAK